jgi:hypothetical protein
MRAGGRPNEAVEGLRYTQRVNSSKRPVPTAQGEGLLRSGPIQPIRVVVLKDRGAVWDKQWLALVMELGLAGFGQIARGARHLRSLDGIDDDRDERCRKNQGGEKLDNQQCPRLSRHPLPIQVNSSCPAITARM